MGQPARKESTSNDGGDQRMRAVSRMTIKI